MAYPTVRVVRNTWSGVLVLAFVLLFAGFGQTVAQDEAAPSAPPPRPGHIHEGSCADLGGVVAPLTNGTLNGIAAEELENPGEVSGNSAGGIPVAASATMNIEASLETILSADHAINFHESDENIATYIACGNLSGIVVNDTLHVGLAELNDSGYTGIAILTDNGDEATNVVVYLSPVNADMDRTAATDQGATDVITPSPSMRVSLLALTLVPGAGDKTVPIGTTIIFTNDDSLEHTVTAADGSFDSGHLASGDAFIHAFDQLGTFAYDCLYHRNMGGTIEVTDQP